MPGAVEGNLGGHVPLGPDGLPAVDESMTVFLQVRVRITIRHTEADPWERPNLPSKSYQSSALHSPRCRLYPSIVVFFEVEYLRLSAGS